MFNSNNMSLTELNHLIYATEKVITEDLNEQTKCIPEKQPQSTPHWMRIHSTIDATQKDLSALMEITRDKI